MKSKELEEVVFVSFGKDSLTLTDLIVRNKIPVKRFIFSDTLMEFPTMYNYAEKIATYYKQRYNVTIEIIKPNTTFEAWCFGVINKGKTKGQIRGIPNPADQDSQCYWRREAKVVAPDKFLGKNIVKLFGYTQGETRSVKDGYAPLRENFIVGGVEYERFKPDGEKIKGYTELDCKLYLENREMENPLYKLFTRTGCAMCPFQSDQAWYQVWKHYPETWEYVKWIESRLKYYEEDRGMKVANRFWFPKYETTEMKEKEFNRANKRTEFDDEPLKNCLCAI